MELRRAGNNLNQIARALNTAAHTGLHPPYEGDAVAEVEELVQVAQRRLMAIYSGNFDYWGLPDAERPRAAAGATQRERERERAAKAERKLRPRRRPAVFAKDEQDAGKA